MYYILFLALIIFCALNLSNNKVIYRVLWVILTLVLVFRYGQGTDYINYNYHYQTLGNMNDIRNIAYYGLDYGFMLMNKIFNLTGLSFQWFVAVISIFMMICLDRFINKFSYKPVLSLFLFYPTYYLTYFLSAIAQGIIIALFIGFMLEWLLDKKILIYVIACVIATTIHHSGLILFLGLLIHVNKEKMFRYITIASFALSSVGVVVGRRLSYVNRYYGSPRFISVAEKLIWLMILVYLSKKVDVDKDDNNLMKLYYIGFIISVTFLFFPTVSSRLGVYYKVLETVLYTRLLYKYKKEDKMPIKMSGAFRITYVSIIAATVTSAMFYKNINQYLVNGKYYNTSFFSYKYISVFNQDELYEYRDSTFRGLID